MRRNRRERRLARGEIRPDADLLLLGEAPALDPSKFFLEVSLAVKAAGAFTPGGRVQLRRELDWLHSEAPALWAFAVVTTHANLLPRYPGAGRKGSSFPVAEARLEAERLEKILKRDPPLSSGLYAFNGRAFRRPERVLLAGRRVARAFRLPEGGAYFREATRVAGIPTYLVPHPSGVNRWWNAPGNREVAAEFLGSLA